MENLVKIWKMKVRSYQTSSTDRILSRNDNSCNLWWNANTSSSWILFSRKKNLTSFSIYYYPWATLTKSNRLFGNIDVCCIGNILQHTPVGSHSHAKWIEMYYQNELYPNETRSKQKSTNNAPDPILCLSPSFPIYEAIQIITNATYFELKEQHQCDDHEHLYLQLPETLLGKRIKYLSRETNDNGHQSKVYSDYNSQCTKRPKSLKFRYNYNKNKRSSNLSIHFSLDLAD